MSKFNQYKEQEVKDGATAWMTLFDLEGEPQILVSPATEANKPYFNASLKRNQAMARKLRGRAMDAKLVKKTRESDRELYGEHVLKGWRKVQAADGSYPEYTKEDGKDFLNALPPEIFDEVRVFCSNSFNFTEQASDPEDEDAQVKNLPSV